MTPPPVPSAATHTRVAAEAAGFTIQGAGGDFGLDATTVLGPARGDGTRPKTIQLVEVDCYTLRAHHSDGRAFVAFWKLRPGGRWTLESAHRAGPYGARRMTATQLKAYVKAPDPTTALAPVKRPSREELLEELARIEAEEALDETTDQENAA